jgi:hypothetical protein
MINCENVQKLPYDTVISYVKHKSGLFPEETNIKFTDSEISILEVSTKDLYDTFIKMCLGITKCLPDNQELRSTYINRYLSIIFELQKYPRTLNLDISSLYINYKIETSIELKEKVNLISPQLTEDEIKVLDSLYNFSAELMYIKFLTHTINSLPKYINEQL